MLLANLGALVIAALFVFLVMPVVLVELGTLATRYCYKCRQRRTRLPSLPIWCLLRCQCRSGALQIVELTFYE